MIKIEICKAENMANIKEFDLDAAIRKYNGECLVGRSPDSGLVLDSNDVSRNHGKFFLQDDTYYFCDTGSSNGSVMNEQAIEKNQPYSLKDGDSICIGEFVLFLKINQQELAQTVIKVIDPEIFKPKPVEVETSSAVVEIAPFRAAANQAIDDAAVNNLDEIATDLPEEKLPDPVEEPPLALTIDDELSNAPDPISGEDVEVDESEVGENLGLEIVTDPENSPVNTVENILIVEQGEPIESEPNLPTVANEISHDPDSSDLIDRAENSLNLTTEDDSIEPNHEFPAIDTLTQTDTFTQGEEDDDEIRSAVDDPNLADPDSAISEHLANNESVKVEEPDNLTIGGSETPTDNESIEVEEPDNLTIGGSETPTDNESVDVGEPDNLTIGGSETPTDIDLIDVGASDDLTPLVAETSSPSEVVDPALSSVSTTTGEDEDEDEVEEIKNVGEVEDEEVEEINDEVGDEEIKNASEVEDEEVEEINDKVEEIKDEIKVEDEEIKNEGEGEDEIVANDRNQEPENLAIIDEESTQDLPVEADNLPATDDGNDLDAGVTLAVGAAGVAGAMLMNEIPNQNEETTTEDNSPIAANLSIDKKILAIAHDTKIPDLIDFIELHKNFFSRCSIVSWASVSQELQEYTGITLSQAIPPGVAGGYQKISALINSGDVDAVIFLKDFLQPQAGQTNEEALLRLCNINEILVATNVATAAAIVSHLSK